jgi:hypothetical protein
MARDEFDDQLSGIARLKIPENEMRLVRSGRNDYLEMEQRWLALARSYEFAERLSNFTEPFRNRKQPKE